MVCSEIQAKPVVSTVISSIRFSNDRKPKNIAALVGVYQEVLNQRTFCLYMIKIEAHAKKSVGANLGQTYHKKRDRILRVLP